MFRKQLLTAILGTASALMPGCVCTGFCQTALTASHAGTATPTSQATLKETQWNLIELDGSAVTTTGSQGRPYIYLQEQGDRLSGSGGCNRFFGSYDLSGDSLEFHSVTQTLMACAGVPTEREPAILEALKLTTSYQISDGVLQLKVGERVLARFEARKK